MSASTTGVHNAFLLWLSGTRLADARTLPAIEGLMEHGALVELDPSPITGPRAQHYQIFSGQSPARSGFFDTLLPQCHLPGPQRSRHGYAVGEAHAGRGIPPQMLPDLLRTAGWSVEFEEAPAARLPDCVAALTRAGSASGEATCKIVKCELGAGGAAPFGAHAAAVADALGAARSWVGEAGLLAVFSDIQPARVDCFVNVNNFLAEMDLLERDEHHGLISWPDSLAYYAGYGQLWVNLLGREPQGAVHPRGEYEDVCATLIKALPAKLRDPATGAQVIERVYRKEELYSSEYLFCAPDLVVVFEPGYAPSPQSTIFGLRRSNVFSAGCWHHGHGGCPSLHGGRVSARLRPRAARGSGHDPTRSSHRSCPQPATRTGGCIRRGG